MPGFNVGHFFGECEDGAPGLNGAPSIVPNVTETARRHRYELILSSLPGNRAADSIFFPLIVPLACESLDRPTMRIQKERVWNGADYANVPLRGEYDPINVTLYEVLRDDDSAPIANWTLESVLSWWTNSSFSVIHSRPGFATSRRVTATIKMLNGLGNPIWAYRLHRCWPEVISPDSLTYKNSEIATVALTLNFDKVEEAIDL